ncbi:probable calcium-binding protein CML18 [Phragmites australis]|uniref:probable calcium-binding protein CML18 n=1 Tax=Phragmites australis TaxID=29695 RepID=UPI002D77A16C|nr:probable calcium-binding protein CML18 [Phragmites australis]
MLVRQPLVENVISASRSICSVSRAVVSLLARDASVVDGEDDGRGVGVAARPPRHCEQSRSDVAAVMASLGLVAGAGGEHDEEDVAADGNDELCGGCAAMAVVDELMESKVASEGELREAFYVFDRDEDGFVGAAELWNVMRRLGMPEGAAYDDCRRMIAAHDGDGDGRISFREFRAMMENAV